MAKAKPSLGLQLTTENNYTGWLWPIFVILKFEIPIWTTRPVNFLDPFQNVLPIFCCKNHLPKNLQGGSQHHIEPLASPGVPLMDAPELGERYLHFEDRLLLLVAQVPSSSSPSGRKLCCGKRAKRKREEEAWWRFLFVNGRGLGS